jgi:hypothetical protein
MSENQGELLKALRALAANCPREAPARLEARLRTEFRKQKRRRALATWLPAFGIATAAGIALLVWIHGEKPSAVPAAAAFRAPVANQTVAPSINEEADAGFYPLPEAEALPAAESAMVVRVQLPVSSLELMGVPVGAVPAGDDSPDSNVQADLLLGQDGLARGIRLVE